MDLKSWLPAGDDHNIPCPSGTCVDSAADNAQLPNYHHVTDDLYLTWFLRPQWSHLLRLLPWETLRGTGRSASTLAQAVSGRSLSRWLTHWQKAAQEGPCPLRPNLPPGKLSLLFLNIWGWGRYWVFKGEAAKNLWTLEITRIHKYWNLSKTFT